MKRKEVAIRKNSTEDFCFVLFSSAKTVLRNSPCLAPNTMLGTVGEMQKKDLGKTLLFLEDLIRRIKTSRPE